MAEDVSDSISTRTHCIAVCVTLAPFPENASVDFEARCCEAGDFEVVTGGVYPDGGVLEAKTLLRCPNCRQAWLLIGQAGPHVDLAEVTTRG